MGGVYDAVITQVHAIENAADASAVKPERVEIEGSRLAGTIDLTSDSAYRAIRSGAASRGHGMTANGSGMRSIAIECEWCGSQLPIRITRRRRFCDGTCRVAAARAR
jgi:hypothetical protein